MESQILSVCYSNAAAAVSFTQNLVVGFTPDVVIVRDVYYRDTGATYKTYGLFSTLTSDIMCTVVDGNGGNRDIPIPLKRAVSGAYTFSLINPQTNTSVPTVGAGAVTAMYFGMTLQFIKYSTPNALEKVI